MGIRTNDEPVSAYTSSLVCPDKILLHLAGRVQYGRTKYLRISGSRGWEALVLGIWLLLFPTLTAKFATYYRGSGESTVGHEYTQSQ
jgi:hypothetical protein